MSSSFPLNVQKLVALADPPFNLPNSSFRYNHLAVESDQYVCVKDVAADGTNQVVVIDLHNDNAVSRRPTKKAEAALMHTKDNIIVLKGKNEDEGGHFIQIFNLDTKTRLLEHKFHEDISFWKWISHTTLAVVTTTAVWHCPIDSPNTEPSKIFDRAGRLAESNVQIIHYCVGTDSRWCLLAGISTKDKRVIDGHLQLFSVDRQQQQFLEGHCGCFGELVTDESKPPIGVFSFTERKGGQYKIHVMDVYSPRGEGHPPPFKMAADFAFPPESSTDFPIFEYLSPRHGVIYLVSRGGHVIVLEALTGALLFRHQLSRDAVFVACGDSRKGGIIFVNRKGEVMSASVDENTLIPYIEQNLRHLADSNALAASLVRRYGYPGNDDLLVQNFNAAMARGDYRTAARTAATMKSGALRTPQTINQFKTASPNAQSNQASPILIYFSTLLELGKLNVHESLELVRPVVAQNRKEFVAKWLEEDKLTCTEALGDLVKPLDATLAMKIYERANVTSKVLQAYVEQRQYDKMVTYLTKSRAEASDCLLCLRSIIAINPEGAAKLVTGLLNSTPPLIDVEQAVDIFVQHGRLQEVTAILLDYLKDDKPEHAALQTRLLELNLTHSTQVAEAIFQMNSLSHYDRARIAQLCERAGLLQRALEHYTEHSDIKRVLSMNSGGSQISPDWLSQYFGKLPPNTCIECLTDILRANRQNLQVVVQAAVKHHERIGITRLIEMFEQFQSWEGIFYFLGSILASSTDPDVHFKYIEAAARLNHLQEVERVCRESQYYDPVQVREFLKEAKLVDPRPLIYVCDRHNFVEELTDYLYKNGLMKFLEVYVTKFNPLNCPTVVGVLVDLDCSEDFIKSLLQGVRGACPAAELVAAVEKRNRLRLLQPWLEARVAEGNQEAALHNALAMIYIDVNRDPETFLKTNAFYDPKVVGKYCEDRDPHLAFVAYKKDWGRCDRELIELTNKNSLFRLQARYLVERQSPELWMHVLDQSNEYRQQVVDQVVASALPECTSAEEVSLTVQAFIAANLPNELMELLEKIVLHNSDFSQNKNLQNLLILTAIKSQPSRVMDYINRLEHYDGPEIAQAALGEEHKMYEEAFRIYEKAKLHDEAVDVLIHQLGSLDRAAEYALRCDLPSVWSKLGQAQLEAGMTSQAIQSFLKAREASFASQVITACREKEDYGDLIEYLLMARKVLSSKDASIDSELVYAYAKCNRLPEMEDFVAGSNTANLLHVADRLAREEHLQAAKLLYAAIPNFPKLASCHLRLREYSQAVDVARRANSPKTWKEVTIACVSAGEFRYAHTAGLAILDHPDHLEELVTHYERAGRSEELIELLEAGSAAEHAPMALYTELGVVYAKYKPERLSDFVRSSHVTSGRLNIPKLIRACESHFLWHEAIQLHMSYKEFDQALVTMMEHPSAWNHTLFCSTIPKVANTELLYRAVNFYLEYTPMDVNALLMAISNTKLGDHSRVVQVLRKADRLALAQPYLEHVQAQQCDLPAVNNALNDLYIEEENVEGLQQSIAHNKNFDQLSLAQKLRDHELSAFRCLACQLFRANGKYESALELAKKNGYHTEAMEVARTSGNAELAERLLEYFLDDVKSMECFAACLLVCYPLLRPDVVLEMAWKHKCTDHVMPFMIQTFRDMSTRLERLEKKSGLKEEAEKSAPNDYVPDYVIPSPSLPGIGGHLALMAAPSVGSSSSAAMPGAFGGGGALSGGADALFNQSSLLSNEALRFPSRSSALPGASMTSRSPPMTPLLTAGGFP